MKDYKAKVTEILDGIGGIHEANEVRTNIIFNLFREIVKEAVGEMETDSSIYPNGGIYKMEVKNYMRSEILSNVEEALK